MQLERLHTDGELGHQVVGGVQKMNRESVKVLDRLGVKRSSRRNQSQPAGKNLEISKPWWELIKDQISFSRLQRKSWMHRKPAVDLLDLLAANRALAPLTGILGIDGSGRSVRLNFAGEGVHNIMIAGDPGSGKSSLIRSLILGLAINNNQRHLQMVIIESNAGRVRWGANGSGHNLLGSLPHALAPVVTAPEDIETTIRLIEREIDIRNGREVSRPLIFVIIEDFHRLMNEIDAPSKRNLVRVLEQGASFGIRVVMSVRSSSDPEILEIIKSNFPVRLIGRMKNKGLFRQLAGPDYVQISEQIRKEPLSNAGQFLAFAQGHTLLFEAAYIDDYDTYAVSKTLSRQPERLSAVRRQKKKSTGAVKAYLDMKAKNNLSEQAASNAHNMTATDRLPNMSDWEYASREVLEITANELSGGSGYESGR